MSCESCTLMDNDDGYFSHACPAMTGNSRKSESYSGHHEEQDGTKKVTDPRKLNLSSDDANDWIENASSSCKLNSISIELLDKEERKITAEETVFNSDWMLNHSIK